MEGTWLSEKQVREALDNGIISISEGLLALQIMSENGDTHAHFGMAGTFIFSERREHGSNDLQ